MRSRRGNKKALTVGLCQTRGRRRAVFGKFCWCCARKWLGGNRAPPSPIPHRHLPGTGNLRKAKYPAPFRWFHPS
jgi:hypothetical protein